MEQIALECTGRQAGRLGIENDINLTLDYIDAFEYNDDLEV